MLYYIKRTDRNGVVAYKHYKCIEGWVEERLRDICWRFSRQGAKNIIKRLSNDNYYAGSGYTFELERVEEVLDA